MTTSTPTDSTETNANTSTSTASIKARLEEFQTRAKAEWATVEGKARAELQTLPARLKTGATQAFDRLRTSLDLPRRAEIAALIARIDDLAARLADYETQSSNRGKKSRD